MNMKRAALILFGLAMSGYALAAPDDLGQVRAEVAKKFHGYEVVSVNPTPIQGIFEVLLAPTQIIYTDAHADYVLSGALIDVAKQVNLTESRLAQLTRIDFSKLPLGQAIKTVKGNGAAKLAVFSDPDCPYCKRLDRDTLSKLDNVTIYTFLFPLDQHTDAARKSGLIWCASDKSTAWSDWMTNGKLPAAHNGCAAPLEANQTLARKLGVRATPTLVLENGELVAGALGKDELDAKMKK